MITPGYIRLMAAYNHWQNDSLYGAAAGLSDDERRRPRGAFFGSIFETLNHLLWADTIWMSRFSDAVEKPEVSIAGSVGFRLDWCTLHADRTVFDRIIIDWAAGLSDADMNADLTFYSAAMLGEVTLPAAGCFIHFFNHQTHHRGQVHAMLTAAGAKPDDTDLFIMPAHYRDAP